MVHGGSRLRLALGLLLWAVNVLVFAAEANRVLRKPFYCRPGTKYHYEKSHFEFTDGTNHCINCDHLHYCPGGNPTGYPAGEEYKCPRFAKCDGTKYDCVAGYKKYSGKCVCPEGNYEPAWFNKDRSKFEKFLREDIEKLFETELNELQRKFFEDLVKRKKQILHGACVPCPDDVDCTDQRSPECHKPGHSGWNDDLLYAVGACEPCPENYFSEKGGSGSCKPCTEGLTSKPGSAKCTAGAKLDSVSSGVETNKKVINTIKKTVELLSISSGDLSVQRAQAEAEVVQRAIEMHKTKTDDHSCRNEKKEAKIVVFPAVEIKVMEVKKLTCLMTNRDRLVGAFCNFRNEFALVLKKRGVQKEAKAFWPNICCSAENEKCGSEQTPKETTVPFAGSAQGGELNRDSLYDEIHRTIKKNGYLHQGMLDVLAEIDGVDTEKIEKKLEGHVFHRSDLCGPREFDMPAPPGQEGKKMCQLFLPFKQVLNSFKNDFERLFLANDDTIAKSLSFLERSNLRRNRKGQQTLQQVILKQMKTESYETCKITMRTEQEYKEMEKVFCYNNHVDLMNSDVMTIAMHRVEHAFNIKGDKKEERLEVIANRARFSVGDVCSPVPMLTADGISMQKIHTDPFKDHKEWVFLMNLDSKSKNGYLQSELSQCKTTDYLPTSNINVAMYIDGDACCTETKDYSRCLKSGCQPRPLRDEWTNGQLAFRLAVRGGDFEWTKSHFVLPGTKFTSPICTNRLEKGKAVNSGNVKNAICKKRGGSLLEVSALQTISVTIPHTGISYVSGQCANLKEAADVFQGVTATMVDTFDFNCVKTSNLCNCIVDIAENEKTVKFKSTSPPEMLTLIGNGAQVMYEFSSGGRRRRRLVQEGVGGTS